MTNADIDEAFFYIFPLVLSVSLAVVRRRSLRLSILTAAVVLGSGSIAYALIGDSGAHGGDLACLVSCLAIAPVLAVLGASRSDVFLRYPSLLLIAGPILWLGAFGFGLVVLELLEFFDWL